VPPLYFGPRGGRVGSGGLGFPAYVAALSPPSPRQRCGLETQGGSEAPGSPARPRLATGGRPTCAIRLYISNGSPTNGMDDRRDATSRVLCANLDRPAADAADAAFDVMLSVRVQGQNYRVTNETLDRLFGPGTWRSLDAALLKNNIRQHYRSGRLVIEGQRLQLPSRLEEAEVRLRSEEDPHEIVRWGVLCVSSQLAEMADELRRLREALQFETAATARLSRDPGDHA
jgi:hypothetical protein